jgi:hypothetical protein
MTESRTHWRLGLGARNAASGGIEAAEGRLRLEIRREGEKKTACSLGQLEEASLSDTPRAWTLKKDAVPLSLLTSNENDQGALS